jgi:UDP-glucuronate decarboxylase
MMSVTHSSVYVSFAHINCAALLGANETMHSMLSSGVPCIYLQPCIYLHLFFFFFFFVVACGQLQSSSCAGKRVAETLCIDYKREHGSKMDVKIVRIFNTYGLRMALDDGRVVSNFVVQALKGEEITLYGDGMQTRSFQYVSDLIDGIVAVMETDSNDWGPYNIGNPEEYTMAELAELVKQVTGSSSPIIFQEKTEDDPKHRKPDITKIRSNLGWEPRVPLEQGLKLMIDDFKTRLGLVEST